MRADGRDARQRPGRDDLAGGQRRVHRIVREQPDEMTKRRERPFQDIGRPAVINDHPVAQQIELEGRQRLLPRSSLSDGGTPRSEQEGTVYAERSHGIGRGEAPPGIDRLHDFEAVSNGCRCTRAGRARPCLAWASREAKDDLRFNARLGQPCQREAVFEIG